MALVIVGLSFEQFAEDRMPLNEASQRLLAALDQVAEPSPSATVAAAGAMPGAEAMPVAGAVPAAGAAAADGPDGHLEGLPARPVERHRVELASSETVQAEARECEVCQDAPREVRFACGHCNCCQSCAELIAASRTPLCPTCRAPIDLAASGSVHRGDATVTFLWPRR